VRGDIGCLPGEQEGGLQMETAQELDTRLVGYRPAASGRRWAVSSGHSLASLAAQRILDRGGNAIDAGVAAGICTNVVQSDMTSFAGVAAIIIYLAREHQVVTISGVGPWPKAASIRYFQDHHAGTLPLGVLRTVVPAAPDAWLTALERFGTVGVPDVMADAITLARDGFPMHRFMYDTVVDHRAVMEQWPATRAVYFPNGRLPDPGELFVQRDLATTLQTLVDAAKSQSQKGREAAIRAARDCFYTGEIGQRIVQFYKQEGGFLTEEDMAEFHVEVEDSVHGTYRDHDVHVCGLWCTGPVLLQMLNMLESFPLESYAHNRPAYLHLVAEVMKLGFADREQYYGDPRFEDVPLRGLLSKAYATERLKLLSIDQACPAMPPFGNPYGFEGRPRPVEPRTHPEPTAKGHEHFGTSALTVVDAEGNAFVATTSDTVYWTPVVPGLGMTISGRGIQSWLDPNHPSSLQPGKRPRLTPNPAILVKDGRVAFTVASPGSDVQPQAMLQVLLNMLHFDMTPQEAVSAPRCGTWSYPNSFYPHAYYPGDLKVESRVGVSTLEQLRLMGHQLDVWQGWDWRAGGVVAIRVDPHTGVRSAGADPRRENYALAW
jgi:gamma-glutamyltranspeptidase/glutathione hydrolase